MSGGPDDQARVTESSTVRPAAVRLAEPGDLERLTTLRAEALAEVGALRGGPLYVGHHAADLPLPDDVERPLWVGLLAGEVVGYLWAGIETVPQGPLGVVRGLYVRPECRAVGVGEALMEAGVEWCTGRGCVGIDAVALPGARATKNFFEESGFTARMLVMHHPLPPR